MQIARDNRILDAAITELIDAGLIATKSPGEEAADAKATPVAGWYVLHLDGAHRCLKHLHFRNATFVIPAWLFDCGVLAIRHPHPCEAFKPIPDVHVRPLVLALRDHDELRFGGIDPRKVQMCEDQIVVCPDGWPVELPYSIAQFNDALSYLLERRCLKTRRGIFCAEFGHLISRDERPTTPDEVVFTVLTLA